MAWSECVHPPADIPLASLLRISYNKLVAGDGAEIQRLFSACKNTGFFYLDLQDQPILQNVEEQFAIANEIFALDDETKRAYPLKIHPGASLFATGYKTPGLGKVDHAGNRDWIEFMNIAEAEVFDEKPLNGPEVLNRRSNDLRTFIHAGHDLLKTVFKCLEVSLNLPPGALSSIHTIGKSTSTQLRMTCSPPTKGVTPLSLQAHTDASTLTLLFNKQSGLQILPPGAQTDDAWLWVQPLLGCAVVNVGDALSIFTNNLLKSIRHRVYRPWGREAENKRYSVLYGLRPDDDAIMAEIDSDGKPVPRLDGLKAATGAEWGIAKFRSILAGRGFVQDSIRKEEKPEGKIFGY